MTDVAEKTMTDEQKAMIEEFQCPGCTLGMDVECGSCKFEDMGDIGFRCEKHSAGTFFAGMGKLALGMPKGFNFVGTIRTGFETIGDGDDRSTNIRLLLQSPKDSYDNLNVPVWAMEKDGYLFVRVMSPRINYTFVDVIKGGFFEAVCPNALDVSTFIDEID